MTFRVLAIDDDPDDLEFVEDILTSDRRGFLVKSVETGAEALGAFFLSEFDCILLDYRLEAQDGVELLTELRRLDQFCPIILLTGQGSEEVAANAIKRGADDYLVKGNLEATRLADAICAAIERAAVERETQRRQDELRRAGRHEALGQLASGIATDFGDLIKTVEVAVTKALEEELPTRSVSHLNGALTALRRASEISQRLVTFSASHPGVRYPLSVTEVLNRLRTMALPIIGNAVALQVEVERPEATVLCDQALLAHALLNLVTNAKEAIQSSGVGDRIVLKAGVETEQGDGVGRRFVTFTVADNGPGMSRDVYERSADPYFTTKARGTGTGLGLSTVYGFVQLYRGELKIDTRAGAGTTVRLMLPMGNYAIEVAEPTGADHTNGHELNDRRYRALVVDSEFIRVVSISEILTELGLEVFEATSTKQALELVDKYGDFDLMLAEVNLPGELNGFDLARKVRRQLPAIKLIYLSGYSGYTETDMVDVVAPLLAKPCPSDVLKMHVERILYPN